MSAVKRYVLFHGAMAYADPDCPGHLPRYVPAADHDAEVKKLIAERDDLAVECERLRTSNAAVLYAMEQFEAGTDGLRAAYAELEAEVARLRGDAERYRKLQGWMASNVKDGWSEVERMGAVCSYVSFEGMDEYLDDLPQCNVGLCAAMAKEPRDE